LGLWKFSEEFVPKADTKPTVTSIPDLSGRHILVVDDVETNRIVLGEFLSVTDATVKQAVDGVEALDIFRASSDGYYDFIFMDLLMPNMNGHDATRAIRNLDRDDAIKVPIVAVTTSAFKDDIEESLAVGMDAHLLKPVDFATIMKVLIEKLD
jgi:CheY-like chemotaxis protein